MSASKSIELGSMPSARPLLTRSATSGLLPIRVLSNSPCRISSCVMSVMSASLQGRVPESGGEDGGLLDQQRAQAVEPGRAEPEARAGDGKGGDAGAVRPPHGRRDGGEADLDLVDRGGVADGADRVERAREVRAVGDRVRREALELA